MSIDNSTLSVTASWKILNCPQLPRCIQKWDDLQPIPDNPKLRYCSACNKGVYYCETEKELLEHRAQGHCIAIKIELIDGRTATWVGGHTSPYSPRTNAG